MNIRRSVILLIVGVLLALVSTGLTQKAGEKKGSKPEEDRFHDEVSYSHDIQPIVKNFCTTCHAGDDPEGEFVLTSYADVRKYTQGGYIRMDLLDTLLIFSELGKKTDEFTFTYLHPGDYYLNVIADMDGDGYPSPGDISHRRVKLTVKPESKDAIKVPALNVKN